MGDSQKEKMMKTICVLLVIAAVACAMPTEKDVKELGDSVTVGGCHPSSTDCRFDKQSSKACSSGNGISNDNKSLTDCANACHGNSNCIGFVYADHGHKCRMKSSKFTQHSNKACPTAASGMSSTSDGKD